MNVVLVGVVTLLPMTGVKTVGAVGNTAMRGMTN
jgi:hypothetical protein